MKAIVNGDVYTPDEVLTPGLVLIEGQEIVKVAPEGDAEIPPGADVIDADGRDVVPGFIDVHMHGAMGHDSMGPELDDVIRELPAFGVTAFLGTTLTLPEDETLAGLRAMAEVLEAPPSGARCLGIHLEGPFLSPEKPGMATSQWFEPFSWATFERLQATAEGHIRLATFAPEQGEGMDAIPKLVSSGVVPVVGHSAATFDQVAEAVALGLNHATHTFNAMPPLHHRHPGVLGAVLYFEQIVAELIADGIHIHPAVMAILLRAKGIDRVALVSDAAPLAGMPEGAYEWEHKTIYVKDGSCRLEDGTIAGAHALLDTGVRNLVELVGLPLNEALVPATRVPADVLDAKKGQLTPGYDADIVILDETQHALLTIVEGDVVYRR
ncbi:MAG: N-acetylglucosamine-6-phosphate deacetylase [Anaerolineae bacterium]